ncbi:hypothetical protein RHGRI_036524 [Rhododendron griersonianum]|uniref:Sugar phosphate transporter domain-containing protein n=1 Tax=Rhododendron griersonianum TaxID=479676 RepID=A0AAV6HP51_9ERIC|nr:hypothetical protein RHGRI_036524 [Rhododendron griersonianum]
MVTYCTLYVAQRLNFFESKPIDMKTVVVFGILNGLSIGFLNLSLGFNSIGFYQAAILFVTGPMMDQYLTKKNVFAYNYSPIVLGFIILSCVIAVFVNFSTFLVIGKTSPVTYQVLGHLKTCLVLGFGYTLLHDPFTSRNILGILVAILGMVLYSYYSTHENKKKQSGDLLPASQVLLLFLFQLFPRTTSSSSSSFLNQFINQIFDFFKKNPFWRKHQK